MLTTYVWRFREIYVVFCVEYRNPRRRSCREKFLIFLSLAENHTCTYQRDNTSMLQRYISYTSL
jgi:hypothetical protein